MLDGTETFDDLLKRSADAGSFEASWRYIIDHLRDRGFGAVGFVSARSIQGSGEPVTDGFGDWAQLYRSTHAGADPALHRAGIDSRIARWSELADEPLPPAPGAVAPRTAEGFVEDLMREGGGDGLFFPLWGPSARTCYALVGFGGPARRIDPGDLAALHAALWSMSVSAIREEAHPRGPRLSPREREVLVWMARGRSNAAIAEIMAVSYHTVDTMVRRIFAKLDASDRTSATVQGLAIGAIELQDVA